MLLEHPPHAAMREILLQIKGLAHSLHMNATSIECQYDFSESELLARTLR